MKQPHAFQKAIIRTLLFTDYCSYTQLKPDTDIPNSNFSFHLDTLIHQGHITKTDQGYTLTNQGKAYANRLSPASGDIITQGKLSVCLIVRRQIGNTPHYLLYTRHKQPFFGCQGILTGKIEYGETILDAAARNLKTKTGLTGTGQIIFLKHILVYDQDTQELLEDKHMYGCLFDEPTGELQTRQGASYDRLTPATVPDYTQRPNGTEIAKCIQLAQDYKTGDQPHMREKKEYTTYF